VLTPAIVSSVEYGYSLLLLVAIAPGNLNRPNSSPKMLLSIQGETIESILTNRVFLPDTIQRIDCSLLNTLHSLTKFYTIRAFYSRICLKL
jgi:hypothetical protein